MEIVKKQTLSETFSVYLDRRMVRILLLGIISGFPWVLIGSSLSLWLKEDGLSRSTIGWAGLIFGVYAINFLWAPLIDRIRIPWLTNKIGHRRGWIVTMQFFILAAFISLDGLDFVTALSGSASAISNVGPGLGDVIGPNGNYSDLPNFSKLSLSLGMLLGRLELFAVLVLFFPSFWKN